jgi:hypothetical protein
MRLNALKEALTSFTSVQRSANFFIVNATYSPVGDTMLTICENFFDVAMKNKRKIFSARGTFLIYYITLSSV